MKKVVKVKIDDIYIGAKVLTPSGIEVIDYYELDKTFNGYHIYFKSGRSLDLNCIIKVIENEQ